MGRAADFIPVACGKVVVTDPCDALFQYALGFVTPADVAAYAPQDPGYENYVRAWEQILERRRAPERDEFDISETIGLTRWAAAAREVDPARFRRFRVLTTAVAVVMLVGGRDDHGVYVPNYSVVRLIDDGFELGDDVLWGMFGEVFEQVREACVREYPEETGFATLGIMLVGAKAGMSDSEMEALAGRLMEEEQGCEWRVTQSFLFGCTHYDQLQGVWKGYAQKLLRPATPGVRLVREALLEEQRG